MRALYDKKNTDCGRLTRRRWMGLAAAAVAAPTLAAETRQEKGRRLLEETLGALGGEKFLRMRNFTQTGRAYSFYRSDLRGLAVISIYEKYDPMLDTEGVNWLPVSRREVFTEKGDYYSLYQNGKGYEVTFRGARPYPEERQQRYRESTRRNIFYMLRYRFDEPGMYFYHKGTEIIDNTPTDAVEIVDFESEAVTVFLNANTHLPVQQMYIRRDPETRIPFEEKSVFSRYRDSAGVTMPWNLRSERDGEKTFELFGHTFEVNQPLESSLFELKQGIPVLPEGP